MTLLQDVKKLTAKAQKTKQQDEQIEIFNKENQIRAIAQERYIDFLYTFPKQVRMAAEEGFNSINFLVYSWEREEPKWVNEFYKKTSAYLAAEGFRYEWHRRDFGGEGVRGWIKISWS